MQNTLTDFLLSLSLQDKKRLSSQKIQPTFPNCSLTSQQILQHIYNTIQSPDNYAIQPRKHRMSLSSQSTGSNLISKCNCKKSKCLKLYCQCFALGSFCQDCNCQCCQNIQQFSQIRAKAIDEMLERTYSLNLGRSISNKSKGCNCKKTQCQKKYCECYNSGQKCGQQCKCTNCSNCG